jgi:hypothetical protein
LNAVRNIQYTGKIVTSSTASAAALSVSLLMSGPSVAGC